MDPETTRLLRETHADVATLGRGMAALIEALKTMSAMQAETLRQILEAVTAPIPESKVPGLLDKIIVMIEAETVIVERIDVGVSRLEASTSLSP